jgi:hypothetical protein
MVTWNNVPGSIVRINMKMSTIEWFLEMADENEENETDLLRVHSYALLLHDYLESEHCNLDFRMYTGNAHIAWLMTTISTIQVDESSRMHRWTSNWLIVESKDEMEIV